jgi:acyl-CoA hydrolase
MQVLNSIEAAVSVVLDRLPGDIVLAIPLGIGKPNPFVNALYRRLKADPSRRLTIYTALSLEKPVGHSELERHFLEPFVARVFEDYPDLDYVKDLRAGQLPAHIAVHEFFLKTGDYLHHPQAQQDYICTNYTFAARDMVAAGVNLVAQAVAVEGEGTAQRLSLSSNPDLTAEVLERLAAAGRPHVSVAVINRAMPFMAGPAVVTPQCFDLVVNDPVGTHALFAPPNMKVSRADHAIGLHAAAWVRDGGTLQIGIGALGDAIAHALLLRHREPTRFASALAALQGRDVPQGEVDTFSSGLYGCSEMFVNGFMQLIDGGVVRRRVYPDAALQMVLDAGLPPVPSLALIDALHAAGRLDSPLTRRDLAWLREAGILRAEAGTPPPGDLDDPTVRTWLEGALGTQLVGGVFMHGGFFLGPRDFYARLRALSPDLRAGIAMHRIDFINQLNGDEALKRAQRRRATFINTTMMVTLLGAAVSDGLEDGRVVSGVGGQYNFVAMAHALPDARSLLLLRATRDAHGRLQSNIVWHYGHCTIPRHLRDVVVTEYGAADLRGQPDAEVIARLIGIADSRFQPELVAAAKASGKLPTDWEVPLHQRNNLPEALAARLAPLAQAGALPDFPFGTDFTDDELAMIRTLKKLKHASENPLELVELAFQSLFTDKQVPARYLERLGLADAHGLKQRLLRRLVIGNL